MADGVIEEVLRLNAAEAKTALGDVAQEATKTSAAIGHVGTTSKASGAALGQLAFQLNDVATMAALGASPFQILASQGGQIAQVAAQAGGVIPLMSAALGKVTTIAVAAAPALGGLAVAVGVVATAYAVFGNALDDGVESADEQNARLATMADNASRSADEVKRLASAWDSFTASAASAKDKIDQINGVEGGGTSAAMGRLQASANPVILADAQRVAELRASIQANEALTQSETASSDERIAATIALQRLGSELATATATLNEHKTALAEANQNTADAAEYNRELGISNQVVAATAKAAAEATKARNEASRRAAELAREEAKAFKALQAEITKELDIAARVRQDMIDMADRMFTPEVDAAAEALRDLDTALAGINLTDAITNTNEFALAQAALSQAFTAGAISVEQYDAAMKRLQETEAADRKGGPDGTTNKVTNVGNAVASGPNGVLTMVGQMGPIGGMVQMILQLITAIGDGLLDEIHAWIMDLFDTIGRLPEILVSAITTSITEGIPALFEMIPKFIESFIAAIPEIIQGMLMMIPQLVASIMKLLLTDLPHVIEVLFETLTDPQMWAEAAKAFAEAIVKMFTGVVDGWHGKDENGKSNPFSAITAGAFADGTEYVSRTGIAMVHAGEEIRQKGGAWSTSAMADGGGAATGSYSGRARVGGSGGKITVEIDPADLAREMNRAASVQGLSFGGS